MGQGWQNAPQGQGYNQPRLVQNQPVIQPVQPDRYYNMNHNEVPRQYQDQRGHGMAPVLRQQSRFNPYARQGVDTWEFDPRMTLDAALQTGWSGARS